MLCAADVTMVAYINAIHSYDEDDNVIREAYFLSNGHPVACVEGYEEERYRRDDSDNSAYRGYFRIVFLRQGELVLCGNSLREVS